MMAYTPPSTPPRPALKKKRPTALIISLVILGILSLACIGVIAAVLTSSTKAPQPVTTAQAATDPTTDPAATPVGPAAQVTTAAPATTKAAPATTKAAPPARATIIDGDWIAGTDFPVGTYQTTTPNEDCLWQAFTGEGESKHYTEPFRGGPGHYLHKFKAGETLSTNSCGTWTQQ